MRDIELRNCPAHLSVAQLVALFRLTPCNAEVADVSIRGNYFKLPAKKAK